MKAEAAKAGPALLSPGNLRGNGEGRREKREGTREKREERRNLSWIQPRKAHGEDGAGQIEAEQLIFALLQHPSPV